MEIWSADERIRWFIEDSDRVHITQELPAQSGKDTLRITGNPMDSGYAKRDWSRLCSAAAFQNLFFWQAFALKIALF